MARKKAEEQVEEQAEDQGPAVPQDRCETCPAGDFPDDDSPMGFCRIRSWAGDRPPERHRNEWCLEHPDIAS